MGLFARIKALWFALLNQSVTEMEEKHVIALAEAKLQQATEKLKDARQGLVSYQAMVLKVQHQVDTEKARMVSLTGQIKSHLSAGQEEMAGELALQLSQVKSDVVANEEQLEQHRQAYENNLLKMKAALKDIEGARKELEKKKAALQMEKALAEVSETAGALNTKFDVTTDIGSILTRVDDQNPQSAGAIQGRLRPERSGGRSAEGEGRGRESAGPRSPPAIQNRAGPR